MSLLDAITTAQSNNAPAYINGSGVTILRVTRLELREAGERSNDGNILGAAVSVDGVVLYTNCETRDAKGTVPRVGTVARAKVTQSKFTKEEAIAAAAGDIVAACKAFQDEAPFPRRNVTAAVAGPFFNETQSGTDTLIKVVSNEKTTQKGGFFTQYTFLPLTEADAALLG